MVSEMKLKDYYHILGVERSSSSIQIKEAYKKLALIYHPDKNPPGAAGIAMKFALITEAYNVLGDLEKRLKYTMLLNRDKKMVEKVKLADYSRKFKSEEEEIEF
jgi:DnaJ-class molecular chaperone